MHVFEAREVLGGAGRSNSSISIWPSGGVCVRCAPSLPAGLADDLLRDGARFGRRLLRTAAGEATQDFPAQYFEKYGEHALMIQWTQLHKLLEERVPKDSVGAPPREPSALRPRPGRRHRRGLRRGRRPGGARARRRAARSAATASGQCGA